MSEEYWDANLVTRRAALPARGSPFRNLADAMGDDAPLRCTGSIPFWGLRHLFASVQNVLDRPGDKKHGPPRPIVDSQFQSRGALSTTSPIAD